MLSRRGAILIAAFFVALLVAVLLTLGGLGEHTPLVTLVFVGAVAMLLGQRILGTHDVAVRLRRNQHDLNMTTVNLSNESSRELRALKAELKDQFGRQSSGFSRELAKAQRALEKLTRELEEGRSQPVAIEGNSRSIGANTGVLLDLSLVGSFQVFRMENPESHLMWEEVSELGRFLTLLAPRKALLVNVPELEAFVNSGGYRFLNRLFYPDNHDDLQVASIAGDPDDMRSIEKTDLIVISTSARRPALMLARDLVSGWGDFDGTHVLIWKDDIDRSSEGLRGEVEPLGALIIQDAARFMLVSFEAEIHD